MTVVWIDVGRLETENSESYYNPSERDMQVMGPWKQREMLETI